MSIAAEAQAALALWGGRTVAGMDLPTVMLAIGGAESGWTDDAAGDRVWQGHACNGYESWGWLQINMNAHWDFLPDTAGVTDPCAVARWLSDPVNAARAADLVIGNPAQDLPASALHPWTTWWSTDGGRTNAGDGNGSWRYHLSRAQQAIAVSQAAPLAAPTPAAAPGVPQPQPTAPTPGELTAIGLGILALFLIGEAAQVA